MHNSWSVVSSFTQNDSFYSVLFSKLRVKIAVNRIWHTNLSFTDYILITRYQIGSILSSFWAIACFKPRLNIWLHIKLNASLLLKWSQILRIYKTARKLYIYFFSHPRILWIHSSLFFVDANLMSSVRATIFKTV